MSHKWDAMRPSEIISNHMLCHRSINPKNLTEIELAYKCTIEMHIIAVCSNTLSQTISK